MEKCYYGCGNDAKFFFKNGKGCCSPSVNKCPYKHIIDSQIKKYHHLIYYHYHIYPLNL